MSLPRHLLHVFSSFGLGGAEIRTAQLMNHFGSRFRHTVVALDGTFDAARRLDPSVRITCCPAIRTSNPARMIARFHRLFQQFQPELLLTYNWGAIDAVCAAALIRGLPVIHTEDGFGSDEAGQQKARRVWFRRAVLPTVYRVVAPSQTLYHTMECMWKLPAGKFIYIPNGVDPERFQPRASGMRARELVVGTIGRLRPEKQLHVLIDICATLARSFPIRLIIAGDGPQRAFLEARTATLGISDKTSFLGHQEDSTTVYKKFDIFALSSATEQMPLSVLEAMSSGLPIVSTDVGDIRDMVSSKNRPFIRKTCDDLLNALTMLAVDPELRLDVGHANRERCVEVFDIARMYAEYDKLYDEARTRL